MSVNYLFSHKPACKHKDLRSGRDSCNYIFFREISAHFIRNRAVNYCACWLRVYDPIICCEAIWAKSRSASWPLYEIEHKFITYISYFVRILDSLRQSEPGSDPPHGGYYERNLSECHIKKWDVNFTGSVPELVTGRVVRNKLCLMAVILCLIVFVFLFISASVLSADEYSFNLDEIEKKTFEWGGYGELKLAHNELNRDGSFYFLNNYKNKRSTLDSVSSILQLNGNVNRDKLNFNWRVQAGAWQDNLDRDDSFDVFEAYASFKPTPVITLNVGKKSFKWGKGYAWSPAAFIDRIRDPNNPEDALEGFSGIECDMIKSFTSHHLQTIALTGVVLPVYNDINGEFGEPDNINFAGKLYLLYRNTDIDFIFYTGNSRSTRYGIDFSKNIAANFEIHGEFAYIPEKKQKIAGADGTVAVRTISDTSYLLGLRYLTATDVTTIAEFYHNGHGFTEDQLTGFLKLADDGYQNYLATGSDILLQKAYHLSKGSYGKPQAGRNYFYTKISIKEPFDILYFTPAITMIANVEDHSYSISPEIMYTGITNFEMRLKFSFLNGGNFSEYGEKTNSTRAELRLRYFF